MAAYQLCYFWAVPRTGVALTALFAICSAPILIATGAALWLKERPTPTAPSRCCSPSWAPPSSSPALARTAPLPIGSRRGALAALGRGYLAVYAVTAKGLLHRIAPPAARG
jgi:DME family drug/metabolite transporter